MKQAEGVQKLSTEEQTAQQAEKETMFSVLARELNTELGKAISDKAPIETRMLADESQYWGVADNTWDKEDVVSGDITLLKVGRTVDNKTRSKTRIASARIGDMLFPTNTPNWSLNPSPYPDVPIELLMEEYKRQQALRQPPPQPQPQQELAAQLPPDQQGMAEQQPPQDQPMMAQSPPQEVPDYDMLAMKVAATRCRKMAQRIRDVLSENDYAKIGRAAIMDGCKLGTGILKGPYVRFQMRNSYEEGQDDQGVITVLKQERVEVPGVARVSPWMWFPRQARCVEECEGSFELHIATKTQLKKMVKTHGFYSEQINNILKTPASLGSIESIMSKRAAITNYSMARYENSYALWEYQGVIDDKVLRTMGFEIPEEDNLTSFYGAVWFVDHQIVRIDMAPLEAESSLPYHVWNYEEDETSIFGFGVPFVMRDDQFVIDMIWSAILHNTSVSAGPQICVEKGVLIPADKSYAIIGPKLWYKNDVDIPMSQAFEVQTIPSTVASTMPVYQQALQNADANTNLPLMLGDGGASGSQQGLSGMAQITVMNQTNIVQRQAAHSWDDNITDRLITKLYHWFMQSDRPEDDDLKGDFQVEVLGASHLLVKDTQAQHAQLILQMAKDDPEMKAMLYMDALYRTYLSFLDIPIDGLVKTPEVVEAEKVDQQPDPMQEAELRKVNAEADYLEAKAQSEATRAQESGSRDMEIIDHAEIMALEIKYAELQDKEREREFKMQVELIRRETKLIEIASKEGIAYETLDAKISSSREKMLADLQTDTLRQRSQDYFDAAGLRLDQYREELRTQNMRRGFDSFS